MLAAAAQEAGTVKDKAAVKEKGNCSVLPPFLKESISRIVLSQTF